MKYRSIAYMPENIFLSGFQSKFDPVKFLTSLSTRQPAKLDVHLQKRIFFDIDQVCRNVRYKLWDEIELGG